jgi:hypothetical protein
MESSIAQANSQRSGGDDKASLRVNRAKLAEEPINRPIRNCQKTPTKLKHKVLQVRLSVFFLAPVTFASRVPNPNISKL